MGFAAHLRYHWMENVLYKPLKTMAVMIIIGVQEPEYAFLVHYVSIFIGHMNHANINVDYKWLKYVFNNPRMHIWHHVKDLPASHPRGMNYGISLSIWDYIFGTAHIPSDGRVIVLVFDIDDKFPKKIIGHSIYPLNKID
jgi:sterol desaturase/sphingolipid hydroxylase (fatty acid hydroxylase superfamily)